MTQNPTPPPLTGASLDRAAHMREDPDTLIKMLNDPAARTLLFSEDKTLFRLNGHGLELEWRRVGDPAGEETPLFLGLADGAPRFVTQLSEVEEPEGCKYIDLRSALFSGDFDGDEAAIAAGAKALAGWHRTHPRCARCGEATVIGQGGWKRACPSCGGQHFPRTDPVVIMIVEHGDRVAVAHNVNFLSLIHI